MSFSHIKDQDIAIRLIRNVIERQRVPSGFLFWGPGGIGKRLTATETAKTLNCTDRSSEADACGKCLSCRRIDNGNHPDVMTVVPEKRSRIIDVEHLEYITSMASLHPYEAKWRVFILLDADRMNTAAQNKFLKTLEEPSGKSLFVLVSENHRLLLPTIRSRCLMVRFRSLCQHTVEELLRERYDLEPDIARSFAALSQGQMDRAQDFVQTEKRDIALSIAIQLQEGQDPVVLAEDFAKNLAEQRKIIEATYEAELKTEEIKEQSSENREWAKNKEMAQADAKLYRDLLDYLYLWETWYRDQLILDAIPNTQGIVNIDRIDTLRAHASRHAANKILAIEEARWYLDRYIDNERVFRNLFFQLAR